MRPGSLPTATTVLIAAIFIAAGALAQSGSTAAGSKTKAPKPAAPKPAGKPSTKSAAKTAKKTSKPASGKVQPAATVVTKPAPALAAKPATKPATLPADPARVAATVMAVYEEALNAFKYQDFDTAIPLFRKVLARPGHLTRQQKWRAREFLGASLWFNGNKPGAEDQFTGLLIKNPQARLDPAYYPPQMIGDFNRVRRKMIKLGMIKADDKPAPAPKTDKYKPPPAILSYIPFGVGQIANDEVGKGIAFMVAETALAATSLYYYSENVRSGAKAIPHTDAAKAGQLVPAIGFYVVAAWGVIDAVFNRRKIDLPQAGTLPTAR